MKIEDIQSKINEAWENRSLIIGDNSLSEAIDNALSMLNRGDIRVAEKNSQGNWEVNHWVKKAVVLSLYIKPAHEIAGGPSGSIWWDRVEPKFRGWNSEQFLSSGVRCVPGSFVRYSAYLAPNVVLMPSFVNIGAHIDVGTMVDTWATVGSCAQIGKNVHISGGAGIGGVLEPIQSSPVIIEDNCFIGARSEVAEGVIVREGSVISMGVYIGMSTKIVNRATGEIFIGEIPPYSVVVPGSLPSEKRYEDGTPHPSLGCAVIVKQVDEKTRAKTSINDLLRSP